MENSKEVRTDLSPWWRYGVLAGFIVVIGALLWITAGVYAPGVGAPVPDVCLLITGAVRGTI